MQEEMMNKLAPEKCIAIIGLSCRLPGASNADEFWDNLLQGRDLTGPLPSERYFMNDNLTDDYIERPTGYLKCPIEEFDAKFFEISPREAEFMDPQQRLLLEVVWESLENAGINPQTLHGSNTAVDVGICAQEYSTLMIEAFGGGTENFTHKYLGNAFCASAGRISHFLGLRGPSIVSEAGCASALQALHYACEKLRNHETNLAISCGVNIILSEGILGGLDSFILSKGGKCKVFDESADGFARSEACASLILKRLPDALADGDTILGIIRGSAVSHDGPGSSLGTPNAISQALLLEIAMNRAKVCPNEISYVECHGTGTNVGDPIEVTGLNSVFGGNGRRDPLIIGSVKSNIGHTESVSGLAGIIKVLMCMKHGIIPKQIHIKNINPKIDTGIIPVKIPLENTTWTGTSEKGLLAGVSSYGLSGTIVHVIVEQPPKTNSCNTSNGNASGYAFERPHHVLTVSAKSEKALQDLISSHIAKLEVGPALGSTELGDLCFSANTTRGHFRNRACVIAKNSSELLAKLKSGQFRTGMVKNTATTGSKPVVAFLFTGQGSQYPEMGKELYHTSPIFKDSFDNCNSLLINNYEIDISKILYETVDRISEKNILDESSLYSQTALFCIEYCLCKLWMSFGVQPDFVLGHSVGEFAAAVCAGILSLEDALKLVVGRGKLVNQLEQGKMLAVRTSQQTVERLLKESEDSVGKLCAVDIAAVNSDEEVVVSGLVDAVEQFQVFCHSRNLRTQVLAARHAFHSREMDKVLKEYRVIVDSVVGVPRARNKPFAGFGGNVRFISSAMGKEMDVEDFSPDYWLNHLRATVMFSKALGLALKEKGCNALIEIGPQPILLALCPHSLPPVDPTVILCPSMRKSEENWLTMLTSLAKLYTIGVDVDWAKFDTGYTRKKVPVPNYPFQRQRFWFKSSTQVPQTFAIGLPSRRSKSIHPLLGRRMHDASTTEFRYFSSISLETLPFIRDHKVLDKAIIPAASFLEAILAAGREFLCNGSPDSFAPLVVHDFVFEAAVVISEGQGSVQMEIILSPQGQNEGDDQQINAYEGVIYHQTCAFDNKGRDAGKWRRVASAKFLPFVSAEEPNQILDLEALKFELVQQKNISEIYGKFKATGLNFGPQFQSMKEVWSTGDRILVHTKIPEVNGSDGSDRFVIHPVVLDAMIQVVFLPNQVTMKSNDLYLPMLIGSCVILQRKHANSDLYVYLTNLTCSESGGPAVVQLYDGNGVQLGSMTGIEFVQTSKENFLKLVGDDQFEYPSFYKEVWQADLGPLDKRADWSQYVFDGDQAASLVDSFASDLASAGQPFLHLGQLSHQYILQAFLDLGWNEPVGNVTSVSKFIVDYSVSQIFSRLLSRYFEILCEEGILTLSGQPPDSWLERQYKVIQAFPTAQEISLTISEIRKLISESYETELRFVTTFGERQADLFQSKISPMTLLFSESKSAESWYQSQTNKQLRHAVAVLQAKSFGRMVTKTNYISNSSSSDNTVVLRILEIGGGTGGATTPFVESFNQAGISYEYTFTDIAPLFVQKAAEKFSSNTNLKFAVLDIEKDPLCQGFPCRYYDFVFADNVIHATRDLRESVRNIHTLLVPGGQFLLFEQMTPYKVANISFGFLDGWWRFEDFDLRPDSPIIAKDSWVPLMSSEGFMKVQCIPIENFTHGMVVGFACDSDKGEQLSLHKGPANLDRGTWLVFGNAEDELTTGLEAKLESLSFNCVVVEKGPKAGHRSPDRYELSPFVFEDFVELTSVYETSLQGIIYAWGISQSYDKIDSYGNEIGLLNTMKVLVTCSKVTHGLTVMTGNAFAVGKDPDLIAPSSATLSGMLLSFRNEFPNQRAITIDVDPTQTTESQIDQICYQIFLAHENEGSIVFRKDTKFVRRLVHDDHGLESLPMPNSDRYKLQHIQTGSASTDFRILRDNKLSKIGPRLVEVAVECVALLPQNTSDNARIFSTKLRCDFAGTLSDVGSQVSGLKVGDRVYGLTDKGALKSHVVVEARFVRKIPDGISVEDGSTLPTVFLTALYFLVNKGRLRPGDKLLVHTASSVLGLAAIQVAQQIGCDLFVTAGSKRKRRYLGSANFGPSRKRTSK